MALNLNNAIRKQGSTYIFICSSNNCINEIKCKPYYLPRHSGKCIKCSHRKEEYRHLFNKVRSSAKNENKAFSLSFDDFKQICKNSKCHYCLDKVQINPFCYENGKYTSSIYGIDRKNNDIGYIKENCVFCCTKCNIGKGNRYSYEEWYGMTKYFRDLKQEGVVFEENETSCIQGVCGI